MIGLLSRWAKERLVYTDLCHDDIQKDTEEPRHDHKNGKNKSRTDTKDATSHCLKKAACVQGALCLQVL